MVCQTPRMILGKWTRGRRNDTPAQSITRTKSLQSADKSYRHCGLQRWGRPTALQKLHQSLRGKAVDTPHWPQAALRAGAIRDYLFWTATAEGIASVTSHLCQVCQLVIANQLVTVSKGRRMWKCDSCRTRKSVSWILAGSKPKKAKE